MPNMPQSSPPPDILAAFGISSPPQTLAGGRSLCFRSGDVVLKPSDGDEEAQWVATFITGLMPRLDKDSPYTLPRPIPTLADASVFVFNGWAAWSFLPGKAQAPDRIPDILRISKAFHHDISQMEIKKPDFMNRPTNRFQEADLVTWGEKSLHDVAKANWEVHEVLEPQLRRLDSLKTPLFTDIPQQLVHGDLTGNVLFGDSPDAPPGIIDMTFYWRPAAWAEAIVVADGLAWFRMGKKLTDLYGDDDTRLQLLVRALQWRMLSCCIDPDMGFLQGFLETTDYKGAVDTVEAIILIDK
jgi:uncharacterized protein (TIGR02569 family)